MYSLKELADRVKAKYIGIDLPFKGIHFDSRKIKDGDLFVAISAERDGHDFISNAIKNGARAVLVNRELILDVPQIIVADTEIALGQLAVIWKSQFDIIVIGLTGSCGKTTVKEMLASIFKQVGNVAYTQGNFNNSLGVPLTLFQLDDMHDFLIVEMGTNNPGEINYLFNLVHPNISLITNIGACHTEGLKSIDGIMQEKGELFRDLPSSGKAIINLDDSKIKIFSQQLSCQKIYYSKNNINADIKLYDEPKPTLNGVNFNVLINNDQIFSFNLNLFGLHQVDNALCAIATAISCGISFDKIKQGLTLVRPERGRSYLHKLTNELSIVDDSYNASFPSVISAIDSLDQFIGTKVLVLSNMGEMGVGAEKYHRAVGEYIKESNIDHIFLYGDTRLISYIEEGSGKKINCYTDKSKLMESLNYFLYHPAQEGNSGTLILIKGSRLNKMEEIYTYCLKEINKI
jgi:UDP-N-acetylmuramoyl-tripeptide--D-alanyl-D-alanine ligase